jgi:hypothetical protein
MRYASPPSAIAEFMANRSLTARLPVEPPDRAQSA